MRLLLIDDHVLFAQSLKVLLAEFDGAITSVMAHSIAEAVLAKGPFDLVLLDLHMPGSHGFAGLHAIRHAFADTPITVLSGEEDAHIIHAAIEHGAMGFVPKSSSPQVLMAAMQLVLAGGCYLPPHVLSRDAQGSAQAKPAPTTAQTLNPTGLSERQLAVVLKAVQGKPNKVIAHEMCLAEGTVKAHLSAAFRTLGVSNRTEAVFKAAQLGLTMPSR